jgi:hypothetical protein
MAGLLGDIFGAADTAKRKLRDVVANPLLSAQQFVGNMNDRARNLNEMTAAAALEGVDYGPASQRLGGLLADAYNPMGITVFHGSPAKFNRFDPTKIGSGEGAQAYGYGHYVAQNPETAKQYKETLKSRAFSKIVKKDRNVYDVVAPDGAVISQGTVLGAAHKAKNAYDANAGALYEIDLPDEQIARMLDYDKPFSQQPQVVKDFLMSQGRPVLETFQQLKKNQTTRDAYRTMMDMPGKTLLDVFGQGGRTEEMLRQAGIPGIRFLDQNSRSNFRVQNSVRGKLYGEPVSFMTEQQARDYAAEQAQKGFQSEIIPGTSNFVVFPGNENLLNIKKRNDDPLGLFD